MGFHAHLPFLTPKSYPNFLGLPHLETLKSR